MTKNILPSLLSFSVDEWKDCINQSLNYGICEFHFDVMEYEYVKNTSFDSNEFQYFLSLNKNIFANVHLMVLEPKKWIKKFISSQTKIIFFHYDVMKNKNEAIDLIHYIQSLNIKAGIVINPNCIIDDYSELLHYIDAVLVMGVYPGFGGQLFIPTTKNNLIDIFNYRKNNDLSFYIEFDGGLNKESTEEIYFYTDKFVMGSYFKKNLHQIKSFYKWFNSLK